MGAERWSIKSKLSLQLIIQTASELFMDGSLCWRRMYYYGLDETNAYLQ